MRRALVVITAAAALAAGCGEDEDEKQRSVTVRSGELRVVGKEYSFDPARVTVQGNGGRLEITLENRGTLAHNVKVFQGDRELGGTPTFQGGETRAGTVDLAPGSYRMVCTVGNHEDLGMVGELTVERKG